MRRIVRQSRRHGLWIIAWSLIGWIGTALAPILADQPLTLMMLSPRALFVALASDSVALLPFVLLGTLRLGVTDASYFIVGKRFPSSGEPTIQRSQPVPRWKRVIRAGAGRGDRLCRRLADRPQVAGAILFVRPNSKYLALAGAYGVPGWVAGVSSAAGTAAFLAAIHVGAGAIL